MNILEFDFEIAINLFNAGPSITVGKKVLRQVSEPCKDYMKGYFFQAKNSCYYIWEADIQEFCVSTKENLKDFYFSKLPEEISFWFFKQHTLLYKVVSEINKPRVYDKCINLFTGYKYKNIKKFVDYSSEIKAKVDIFLEYVKSVLASNNLEHYEYIMKWLANLCQGNKNESCLYLKGPEGIGKSTMSDFMMKWVLGTQVATKADPDVIKGLYNRILCGKLLVVFEELPNFSPQEWSGISARLRDMITGELTLYQDKYEKKFQALNFNSYIVNTNDDALKGTQGRRFFPLVVSTKRREDHAYFGNIIKHCFNAEVGEAFFSYLQDIDISNWHGQKDMPETQAKLNSIAELLAPEYKFLKYNYLFENKSISTTARELFEDYEKYCTINNVHRVTTYIKFTSKLGEIGIDFKKSHGVYKYKISLDDLKALATKFKWIHQLDEYKPNGHIDPPTKCDEVVIDELRAEVKRLNALLNKVNLTEIGVSTIEQAIISPQTIKLAVVHNDFDLEEEVIVLKKTISVKPKRKSEMVDLVLNSFFD